MLSKNDPSRRLLLHAVSSAPDLSPADREWAESIAQLAQCSVAEAEKRVRRIRYDPRLAAYWKELSSQLGSNMVITNVEWSGLEMKDISVSVMPNPIRVAEQNPTTPNAYFAAQIRAQRIMRHDVALFEVSKVFGLPKSCLYSMLVGLGGEWPIKKPDGSPEIVLSHGAEA